LVNIIAGVTRSMNVQASIIVPATGSAAPQCGAISLATAALRAADRPGRTGVRRSQSVGLKADRHTAVAGTMIDAGRRPKSRARDYWRGTAYATSDKGAV